MAAVSQLEHWDWIRWTSTVAWEGTALIEDACTRTRSLKAEKNVQTQYILYYLCAHTYKFTPNKKRMLKAA